MWSSPAPSCSSAPAEPSRLQLALDVEDLDASIASYRTLLGAEPAKVREGYADVAIDDPALELVLIHDPGHGGSVNHLGIEVDDTAAVEGCVPG